MSLPQKVAIATTTDGTDAMVTREWIRFFNDLTGTHGDSATVTGASPFSFTAPSDGIVFVSGGTVSLIEYARTAFFATGATAGPFFVFKGDILRVTYTVVPTIHFVPQ